MSGTASSRAARWPLGLLLSPVGLTLVGLAQLADLATFLPMVHRVGIAGEANPLVISLYHGGGLAMLVEAKIALWALVAIVTALLAMHEPRLGRLVVVLGVLAGVLGALSNLITL